MTLFNDDFVDYRSYEINVTDIDARKSFILCETSCIETASAQYEAEKLYRERICSMINGNEFTHEIFKIANKPGLGEINFGYWNGTIKNGKFVKMKFNVIWRVFMEYSKINFEVNIMGDAFERVELKVHEVKWDLEKVRSVAIHNKNAVEWVQHITNATYGMIKTDRNQKLLVVATDAVAQYENALLYIYKALECIDKVENDLKEYNQIMEANPNVKVSNTPDT